MLARDGVPVVRPRRPAVPRGRAARAGRGAHVAPPSALNSTRSIAPNPDHARPWTAIRPARTCRIRERNSGIPGGAITDRGNLPGHPLAGLVRRAAEGVQHGLLDALERLGDRGDRAQPLDRRHAVPAGHDEPQGEAVRGRERRAVHRVGEQHVVPERLLDREAALVVVLDPLVDPAVVAGEARPRPRRRAVPPPRGPRAAGVPVHSAQPIASSCHGADSGRGVSRARPEPAHSIITGSVTAGRARSSSSPSASGRATRPSTPRA